MNPSFRTSYLWGITLTLVAVVICSSACTYNNEAELYPIDNCIDIATFTATVLPIFNQNCIQCHATGLSFGGVTLDQYSEVKKVVDSDQLLGAIRHDSGFSPMPQGNPQLSDCNISKIEYWVANGALDN